MPPKKTYRVVFKTGSVVWIRGFSLKEAKILAQARAIEAGQAYDIATAREEK